MKKQKGMTVESSPKLCYQLSLQLSIEYHDFLKEDAHSVSLKL